VPEFEGITNVRSGADNCDCCYRFGGNVSHQRHRSGDPHIGSGASFPALLIDPLAADLGILAHGGERF
jgi:hypothetical protein